MGLLNKLFGPKADFAQLIADGTTIIDVRSTSEYKSGALPGSKNIPIDRLANNVGQLKKDAPVILVCASGMRSGAGKRVLKSMGFEHVHNGGSWGSLIKYFPED